MSMNLSIFLERKKLHQTAKRNNCHLHRAVDRFELYSLFLSQLVYIHVNRFVSFLLFTIDVGYSNEATAATMSPSE